ncbi:hypothetical protein [Spiroplasma turonicum]|uniref:Uncharacterized protein n=1 Tax=Spiroplasma turonicum TaxID=216946 RepID=A0A0K1P7I3_9MOLU|nr:hypothetical protein [Spiroplasma turonicum]AKU79867.1 hypothetical protein STURON_00621 [Spiroplasma turonicum]ALX70883.1 hypothetical protein STURO_v1c06200 [Spiroplasma turonicum]
MKITNKITNKNYTFTFLDKNIFLLNDIEMIEDINNCLSLIFSNKFSTSDYDISMSKNDIQIDKSNCKLVRIPSFLEFSKDICGGNKSILKDLIILCLKYNAFSSESITNLFSFINTIDLCEIKVLENLLNNLNNKFELNFNYLIQDQIINYIAEQTILEISHKNDNDNVVLLNQKKLRSIYIEILKLLLVIEDKNLFFIFINPFFGLDYNSMKDYFDEILNLKNYIIITDKFLTEDYIDYWNLKLYINNNFIDFSNIYDDLKFYMNFSNTDNLDKFKAELLENIYKIIINFNNKLIDLNYPVFQYIINL